MKPRSAARRVLAGLALVVVAASACTTHAGAAAQVGDQTIETSTLRGIVDRGVAVSRTAVATASTTGQTGQTVAPVERGELQRQVLTSLVNLDLLQQEARELGVSVTGQDVDAYYQAYGVLQFGSVTAFENRAAQVGTAREDLRRLALSGALQLAVTDRLTPDAVASETEARDIYDQIVGQVGKIPLTYTEARPYLVRLLASDRRTPVLQTKLREISRRESVSINPRFGNWDPSQLSVVAADGSVATTPAPEPSFRSGLAMGQ